MRKSLADRTVTVLTQLGVPASAGHVMVRSSSPQGLTVSPSGARCAAYCRDLVSDADLAAERAIAATLASRRPGDGILGEQDQRRRGRLGH